MNDLIERLKAHSDDPMWPDHAEVPKAVLRESVAALSAHPPPIPAVDEEMVRRGCEALANRWRSGVPVGPTATEDVRAVLAAALLAARPACAPVPEIHSYDPTDRRESVTIRWEDGACLSYVLDHTRYTNNLPASSPVVVDRVARAMAESEGWLGWDSAVGCNDTISGNKPEQERKYFLGLARVAIDALVSHPAVVDGRYPAPRNRTEAAALARIALAHLGVIDAHIEAAIARCEAHPQTQGEGE